MTPEKTEKDVLGRGVIHPSARPMQVMLDADGVMWLCDKNVDPQKAFAEQDCWTCDKVTFTRGG